MSERMNKERAREIINTEVIETLKSHQQMSACFDYDDDGNAKPNNNYAYYDELLQALDIAIESLEQNIQTIIVEREFTLEEMNKGLEYCTYKAHRELIKRLLELKLIDIKSMNDIFGKGIVEFRLKVVEPYERKEQV